MTLALYFNLDLTLTTMTVPFSEVTTQVFEEEVSSWLAESMNPR